MSFTQIATWYFAGDGMKLFRGLSIRKPADDDWPNFGYTLSAQEPWLELGAAGKYSCDHLLERECYDRLTQGTYILISHCTMDDGAYLNVFINGQMVHEDFRAIWDAEPWTHWLGGTEADQEFLKAFWYRYARRSENIVGAFACASPKLRRWLKAKYNITEAVDQLYHANGGRDADADTWKGSAAEPDDDAPPPDRTGLQ